MSKSSPLMGVQDLFPCGSHIASSNRAESPKNNSCPSPQNSQIAPLGKTHHIHLPVFFWSLGCRMRWSTLKQGSNMLKLFGRTKFVSWKQTHSDASAHYFLDQTILVQTQLPMYRATAPYFSSVIRCFSTDTRPAPWPYSEFTWATSRPWTRPASKNWGPTHSPQSTASICWFMAWSIEGLFGSSDTTWKWSDPGLWASHPSHIVYEITPTFENPPKNAV